MLQTRHSSLASLLLCALALSAVFVTARGQTTSPADQKLSLNAALVLTPEFCATIIKKGSGPFEVHESYEVGQAACADLEPALKGVFSSLTRVAAAPSSEEAQVVLLPRFVDVNATRPSYAGSTREMVVLLEWTVKDKSGKTVWIETVRGSAQGELGALGSVKKNRNILVEDAVKNTAENSASKMASSPELGGLALALAPDLPNRTGMAALAPSVSAPLSDVKVILKKGIEVKLRFAEEINSKITVTNDPVSLTLDENLTVGDVIVVRAGAKAVGTISKAKKAGMLGKGGELDVQLDFLIAGDNKVKLQGNMIEKGKKNL